eukprot:jgi/Mesvir1/10462/Mv22801-RA.1
MSYRKQRTPLVGRAIGGRGDLSKGRPSATNGAGTSMQSSGDDEHDIFFQLDDDLLARIISCLPSPKDFGAASSVCRRWNRVSKFPGVTAQFIVGIQLTKYEQGTSSPMITRGHKSPVTGLSSSGSRLFSSCLQESTVRIWNTSSRTRSGAIRCEHVVRTGFPITAIAASGSRLFAVCTDMMMLVWRIDDAGSRKPVLEHSLHIQSGVNRGPVAPVLCIVPSGSSRLFSLNALGAIGAWDISDERRHPVLQCVVQPNQEPSDDDGIVADKSRLFFASSAGIKAWRAARLDAEPVWFARTDAFPTLALSGNLLYASSSGPGVKVWDVSDLTRPACLHTFSCAGVASLCAWNGYLFAGTLHGMAVWDIRHRGHYGDKHGHALFLHSGKVYEIMTGLQAVGGEMYAAVGLMGCGEGRPPPGGHEAIMRREDKHVIAAWSLLGATEHR